MYRKATGIVKRVDDLGRIHLPKDFRESMDIQVRDPLAFFVTNDDGKDYILLTKYETARSDEITIKKQELEELAEMADRISEGVYSTAPDVIGDNANELASKLQVLLLEAEE